MEIWQDLGYTVKSPIIPPILCDKYSQRIGGFLFPICQRQRDRNETENYGRICYLPSLLKWIEIKIVLFDILGNEKLS